jgi:uncharacterized protein YcbX
MRPLTISQICIYPIKSLAGIPLTRSKVTLRGLEHDRRWVLADKYGKFISQREHPELALLQPVIQGDNMLVSHKHKNRPPLLFRMGEPDTKAQNVTVWDDTVQAKPVSNTADAWFSRFLNMPVQLLYMHEDSIRPADHRYAINPTDHVSFADGYPILLISEASLARLNEQATESVPMSRFRPNVVIKHGEPHIEDRIKIVKVGHNVWHGVKPCGRCIMTTIDQETAQKRTEPLLTLSKYRKIENKVLFGENFIPMAEGEIRIGQQLFVEQWKDALLKPEHY